MHHDEPVETPIHHGLAMRVRQFSRKGKWFCLRRDSLAGSLV